MKSNQKQIFIAFAALIFLFYPDLFFVLRGPLAGDHLEQHYPWGFYLDQALQRFRLPFWTSMIHCGFPIAAEGQIGIFYLPNLLFYFFLPFHFAYSYLFIFHLWLSGWGVYLYSRAMGLSPKGAFFAAFLFTFGSGYGGAYYNLTSLKTICWLPLSLYLWEKYLKSSQRKYLIFIAFCLFQSLMAGYLQVATLTFLVFILYGGMRAILNPRDKGRSVSIVWALMGAVLLSAPQLWLTFELAIRSNRAITSEAFAYVGSMPPTALITLFLPYTQGIFRGISLYSGVFSLFFVLLPFTDRKLRQTSFVKIWVFLALFSLLIAAGEWSPLYTAMVKLTHFYSFRTPSKFIIFALLSFSLIAGIGLDKALSLPLRANLSKSCLRMTRFLTYVIGFVFLGSLSFFLYLNNHRNEVYRWGETLIERMIHGRPGHPYDMDVYAQKLNQYLDTLSMVLTPASAWNLYQYLLLSVCFGFLLWLIRKRKLTQGWLRGMLALLFIEIYVHSFYDLRKDFASYATLNKTSGMIERLLLEKKENKLGRIYGIRSKEFDIPLIPCLNMIYGIEDIGAYSPLVTSRYFETIGGFGNVNDSNGFSIPPADDVKEHLPLLAFLNVSHILSSKTLEEDARLELLDQNDNQKILLYRLQLKRSKAHFMTDIQSLPHWNQNEEECEKNKKCVKHEFLRASFDPSKTALLESSEAEKIPPEALKPSGKYDRPNANIFPVVIEEEKEQWRVQTDTAGLFVLSNLAYPGWTAHVNGQKTKVITADGLFLSVWIPVAGEYEITFSFKPFFDN